MVSRIIAISFLFSAIIPFLAPVSSAGVPTTCYVLNGTHRPSAGYRCDNTTTGHSACCAPGAICYSNGVCQQTNGQIQDYLRVGCTDKTWQDPACLDQCVTFAPQNIAGIRFCDGAITSTNQYCCDNGTYGTGSFACCDTPSSLFAINPIASVLAQMPLSQLSSTSTAITSSSITTSTNPSTTTSNSRTSTTSTTTTSSSTPTGNSNNHAVAIGAGVGVPLGIIALAGLGFLVWRHQRNAKRQRNFEMQNGGTLAPHYADHISQDPQEVEATSAQSVTKAYFGGRKYGYESTPQELPNSQTKRQQPVHEIGS